MAWHANDRRHEHGGNPAVEETLLRTRERGSVGARFCQANSRCNLARQAVRGASWAMPGRHKQLMVVLPDMLARARWFAKTFSILRSFAAYINSLGKMSEGREP
jgi:hypothetical protein